MKRLLNCHASDFAQMSSKDLLQSIRASEGRVMVSEVICATSPLYPELTNAEFVAAFGADMVLLNIFDVNNPNVEGMSDIHPEDQIRTLKQWLGRPVGINLEPVDKNVEAIETLHDLPTGRMATKKTILQAKELGVDFICLTGNPQTGVSNDAIIAAIREAKAVAEGKFVIIAGKMHGAGVKSDPTTGFANEESVREFVKAGADIILVPGVGTVPGATLNRTEKLIQTIHQEGALALTAIGTSQEGAKRETMEQMAIYNKMAGADVHHIGDAGFHGIANPENIMDYSIAIRGKRHTYIRMAQSVLR